MSARRLMLVTVVSCLVTGGSLLSVTVALAVTPPVVEEESVVDVAGTSATLQAKIDPQGNETTYRFEYGTTEAYGSSIPAPDGLVGSGSAAVAVSAHPQGLLPSTEYHFRVVALVASSDETLVGDDETFTTQPSGGELALPDGRQWELVSPANKHGALIRSLHEVGPLQAAENGDAITYNTSVPTESEPAGYAETEQVVSVRGSNGWSSRDIGTPHDGPPNTVQLRDYLFFSSNLSSGLAEPNGKDNTLLSSEASEATPYIRRESLCDAAATASYCYLPLVTSKEGSADVPPTTTDFGDQVDFEGASPDLSHAVLASGVALTETPIAQPELYEWSAGAPAGASLQLVSLMPTSEGGGPASGAVGVGPDPDRRWSGARYSISGDGSRVFWQLAIGSEEKGLYMRDTLRGETVRLDVQQAGAPSGGQPKATFQIASSDGSKVFFTDEGQRLTAQSGAQGSDLYECEIVEEAGRLKCLLTDLTPESNGSSAEVQNMVLGASANASYVYFVANGVLPGSGASTQGSCGYEYGPSSGLCNLYVYHEGKVTFIATLANEDQDTWGSDDRLAQNLANLTAQVSPDGRYLAFMSEMPLTGYNTLDEDSGKPDQEVYLYDAQTKRLVCASCDPTGSRPVGVKVSEIETLEPARPDVVAITESGFISENWVAANLSPGNRVSSGGASLYQPQVLSDNGRLFFNSYDALVPQDVNGQEDVYEYEPVETGSCTSSGTTYSQKTAGCVSLISSGSSPEESGLVGTSEDGRDAFFLTASQLTSQDFDTSYDIYDARECTESTPCTSAAVPAPPCDTGDSCKPAASPQPPIFGAPASSTFTGSGNVTVSSSVPVVKVRSLTRAQKLERALNECRKKPKRRQAACKRQAKKRYAAKGVRKAAKSTSKGKR